MVKGACVFETEECGSVYSKLCKHITLETGNIWFAPNFPSLNFSVFCQMSSVGPKLRDIPYINYVIDYRDCLTLNVSTKHEDTWDIVGRTPLIFILGVDLGELLNHASCCCKEELWEEVCWATTSVNAVTK
jgi:hypothetical protein